MSINGPQNSKKVSSFSLILCTHNPRKDYLNRVVESCFAQITDLSYELVVVDSASDSPLEMDLTKNGISGNILRVDEPGLAKARYRGIKEARGDVLVFVDDDTVLDGNYLSEAKRILDEKPFLGAIGGQLIPEYEIDLPLPESYFRNYLAIREFDSALWSNRWDDFKSTPIGGGMVIRKSLAFEWCNRFDESPWRQGLGRNGKILSGGEDVDLIHTVCDIGFGKGIFPELKLVHLMPESRLNQDFLVRIFEGNCRSGAYLSAMLNPSFSLPPLRFRHRFKVLAESLIMKRLDRRLYLAGAKGRWEGWRQAVHDKKA